MSDKTKKIVFAIVFFLMTIVFAIGLYELFYKPLVAPTTPPPATPISDFPISPTGAPTPPGVAPSAPGELPPSAVAPGITEPGAQPPTAPTRTNLLRDAVTQALSTSNDGRGGARFYSPTDGHFYRINEDGSITMLSEKQFLDVSSVTWGKKTDEAIMKFPDGSNVFYDFTTQRQSVLPSHWQDFTFSPDDQRVVGKSIGLDPDNRFLIIASPKTNEAQAIQSVGNNADLVMPSWSPNNQVMAFSKTGQPQADGSQEIYLLGAHQENFKSLNVPGRGFIPNWSPSGQQLLYSAYHQRDDFKPMLWVSGAAGDNIGNNRRSLGLHTWADKCVWANESILYCGVPQQLDRGAGISRSQFATVPDDVYRVDLRTGLSTKISTPDQNYPINQPTLNKDKTKLLFTDTLTGRLYSYNLP